MKKSVCGYCGKVIVWNGSIWKHADGKNHRHISEPVFGKKPEIEKDK